MFSIYTITDIQTHKIYVGQTSRTPAEKRWKDHVRRCNAGERKYLYEAMRLRGINSFAFDVIEICETQNEANDLEKKWIIHFDSMKAGYNMTEGGEGRILSSKVIEHLREINTGENNFMYGKHHTLEAKAKISAANFERFARGEHPSLGKKHTDERKHEFGCAMKKRWSDPEYKKRLKQKACERWERYRNDPKRRVLIKEIQNRLADGETGKLIANELNVSPAFVSAINRGHLS